MSSEMDINCEFSEENGIADLTLVVEEHKIPVSKAVLCIASPVFRVMLEGDFREKTKAEIPLPGKKYEDFVEFLRCIYPDKTKKVKEIENKVMWSIGSVSLDVDKELEYLKALRLTERIQQVNANSGFKQNVLKWLQDHYNKTEHCEQYDLLPENIKSTLEMQGHDN